MKIALLSDLHLSVAFLPLPDTAADVLVITGDIARQARAMEWARAIRIPTVYAKDGMNENARFDPALIIELGQ